LSFIGNGGVQTVGDINTLGAYKVNTNTVINSSGAFVGAGVNCPSNGIAGSGFNPNVGGTQYFGTSSATFTTTDGKTVTVKGGAVVSVV
jgi:hypothetical protein